MIGDEILNTDKIITMKNLTAVAPLSEGKQEGKSEKRIFFAGGTLVVQCCVQRGSSGISKEQLIPDKPTTRKLYSGCSENKKGQSTVWRFQRL